MNIRDKPSNESNFKTCKLGKISMIRQIYRSNENLQMSTGRDNSGQCLHFLKPLLLTIICKCSCVKGACLKFLKNTNDPHFIHF